MKKQFDNKIREEIATELTSLLEKMIEKHGTSVLGEFFLETTQMAQDLADRGNLFTDNTNVN